jgi:hypothetical protein
VETRENNCEKVSLLDGMSHYQLFLNPGTTIPSSKVTYALLNSTQLPIDNRHHRAIHELTDYLDAALVDPKSWLMEKIRLAESRKRRWVTLSCDDGDVACMNCYTSSSSTTFYSILRRVVHHSPERLLVAQQALRQRYSVDYGYGISLNHDGDLVISWL